MQTYQYLLTIMPKVDVKPYGARFESLRRLSDQQPARQDLLKSDDQQCLTLEQQIRFDIYKASGARPWDVSLRNEHAEAFRQSINEACQFILTGEVAKADA